MPLNIVGNMLIDSEERFLRLTDSFGSFAAIRSGQWLLNLRGRYADIAGTYLKKRLQSKCTITNHDGFWKEDTLRLINVADESHSLIWVEDHICMCGNNIFDSMVQEVKQNNIDIMCTTFWEFGGYKARYDLVSQQSGVWINYFTHDFSANELIQKKSPGSYIVCLASIFSNNNLKRLLKLDAGEKKFSPETPFGFEVPGDRVTGNPSDWYGVLPMKRGIPKLEIFCSIEHDRGIQGASLQSRGVYPRREGGETYTRLASSYKHIVSSD